MDDFIPRDNPQYAKNLKKFHGKTPDVIKNDNWYHGTPRNFSSFQDGSPIFLTRNPYFANQFTGAKTKNFQRDFDLYKKSHGREMQPNIMPVHVRAENPFDYENRAHINKLIMHLQPETYENPKKIGTLIGQADRGDWSAIEDPIIQKAIREMGHDSFFVNEEGEKNLAVYNPTQIKSALGNVGGFNREEEDINKAYGGALGDEDDDEGITAYHGSPHDFPTFDMSKIGTGEGAQSYGHGLYFAESEPVANTYRGDPEERYRRFSGHMDPKEEYAFDLASHAGEKTDWDIMKGLAAKYGEGISYEDAENLAKNAIAKRGHMYEVRIKAKPEHFIDWDAPISEQDPYVWSKLVKEAPDFIKSEVRKGMNDEKTWGDIYGSIVVKHPRGQQGVTEHLAELGIPGVRYLDQGSRGTGEGTRNYVVFDDKLVNTKRKYEEGGEVEMPAKKKATGRIKRNTGGRIPEMDKLFKRAKKYVDEQTKPMLNLHDDVIVKALNLAKKKV